MNIQKAVWFPLITTISFTFFMAVFTAAFAGEIPPPATHATTDPVTDPQIIEQTAPRSMVLNHEARIADTIYVTELPQATQVTSKPFQVPPGWEMVEVMHPDEVVCSSYPQPSTWELKQIYKPVTIQPVPDVGEDNAHTITKIIGTK